MHDASSPKAVLALSSHVARGSVGLRAAGFAIERLGLPLWKVPTIWLPWHPGHARRFGVPPRHAMPDEAFEASLQALVGLPVVDEVGAILTGYFASAGQVHATCRAIDRVRAVSPDVLVVCDPVSADAHGTYVPDGVVTAIREELLPRCDVATPNRFELTSFAGAGELADNAALIESARALGIDRVVVTSAFGMMKNAIGTLFVEGRTATLAEHALVPGAPHGTGDVFSALLTAHLLMGQPIDKAVGQATASVFEMVARSVKAGSDELLMAREQASLISPMTMVTTRHLAAARAT
jgi:pyridoxine kinase